MSFILGSAGSGSCLDSLPFDLLKSIRWGCQKSYHDTKCATQRIEEIQEWLKKNSKYRILVTGKIGSGKTTFIRGLTENFLPPTDGLLPHTIEVSPYEFYHEGSNCIFFDTPGLKDNEEYSNDYEYIKEMIRKNGEPNLLVFALKMNGLFDNEDKESIANITSAFGWQIWRKAMFILTFANLVEKTGENPGSVYTDLYFNKEVRQFRSEIERVMQTNEVHQTVIDSMPVTPVGVVSEVHLAGERHDESWIDIFWEEAFKIIKTTQGLASS